MKKRGLSLFMVLVLCLTLLPTAAFAEGEDVSISGGVIGGGETGGEGGGIYVAPGSPTEGGGGKYIPGEDTRTEIWCVSKPDSIGRSYDGTTDGSTIPINLTFTDGTNKITLEERTDFNATKTFDSADAGWHTVTVEIALIGEAAAKYKLKAGEGTFTIGGNINKAYPDLTVSLSKTACTAGEKLLPLLSVEGAPEDAEVTYYYLASALKSWAGSSDVEGGEAMPKIDENTAISEPGTYYVYAKSGETKNYEEDRSATVALTVTEPAAASVTRADGTVSGTYKTLPAALDAAQDGDTVKLLANHTTNWSDVEAGEYATLAAVRKTLTLDLNGMTVDYLTVGDVVPDEAGGILESYDGNLTVVDNIQGGSCGKIKDLEFVKGSLAIQGGRIGDDDGSNLTCNENSGAVTISGGTVCNATVGKGVAVTVSGGSMHQEQWVNNGTLNIMGGTFGSVKFYNNSGTIAISGGTFSSLQNFDNDSFQIAPMSLLAPGHAFYDRYNENIVKDGSSRDYLRNVTVKEHTHTMVNNKCACGLSCTHTNAEGASTIGKDGKCTACGTQFAAGIGEIYYTDVKSALDAAADGQTVRLLANEMLSDGIYVSKTLTLDLDGHSLSGYSLNVGGLTATSQVRTGKLTVIDSSGGNGAVGVTVREGGTLVFDPKNDHTTLLQLEVWGGTVELYGGKISRSGLQLYNKITLGNLLPGQAGLAYYHGDAQLTLEEAASQTCDLVVKSCSHGGKNGFDGTNCPYCNAPAVAETALNNGEGNRPWRRFADLQTALDADRDGGAEFKLLADVTGDYTINGTQDTGLDLNGHSIKGTVTVKAAAGSNTTTLSNTKNTTTASIDKVVAHRGAKLAGSGYPAVIGKLTLADTMQWKDILQQPTRLGFKVTNADGTYQWYAPNDVKGSQLNNVIINSLPITTKTLNLKVNGKNLTDNPPKVERGTTVQLCASCNTSGADVYIYTGEIVGNNVPTYSQKKAEYKKIGTNWYYVVDFYVNTIGTYDMYFTATKDGYKVTSTHKKLTVTKPNLSKAEITFPYGNEAAFNYSTSTGVPTFIVTYNGQTLEKDKDFTIDSGGSTYDVGPCTLTIKATDKGDYTGSKSAQWNVRPLKVAASVGDIIKTYDGTTDLPANAKITFKSADSYYTGTTLRLAKGTDYEVSNAHYDSADASETEKTVSFTIELKNAGYVFEDGTTQKDFTLNGADFDDKTFQINKAAAPTDIQTGTLNVVNGTKLEYTYDAKQLLPKAPKGTYGKVSYNCKFPFNLKNGYYVDDIAIKDSILTLTIDALNGGETGKIGTIPVYVTTDNYASFNLPLNLYAVNKITPVADGEITAAGITYGDALSKSTISGKMKDPNTGATVNGTFAWKNGTIQPAANDSYEAEWVFTPAEGYEEYATATGTVTIKVKPAKLTVSVKASRMYYTGEAQIASIIASGQSVDSTPVTFTYSDNVDGNYTSGGPTFTDAGTYTVYYKAEAANHEPATGTFTVTIDPLPISLLSVSSISKTYDGSADVTLTADKLTFFSKTAKATNIKLPDTVLSFSNAQFTKQQADGSYLPSPEVGGGKALSFTMMLTSNNYVFEGKSGGTTEVSDVFATDDANRFTITKAAAPTDIQTGTLNVVNGTHQTYTYDFSKLLPELSEGQYGTISYGNQPAISLVSQSGYYYDETIVEFKKGNLTLAQFYAEDGTMTGQIGTVKVKVTTTNYEDFQLTLVLNAVNQITPVGTPTLSRTELTYGEPLSAITLSGKMKDPATGAEVEGTFAWQNPDTVLNASTTGRDAEWKFTPTDKAAYTETTGTAFVKVDKAMQSGTVSMADYTYGETPGAPRIENRTGDLSASVTYYYARVGDGNAQVWDIDNPPALNAGTYRMFARIGATSNYYEYSAEYCEFVVAKATPPYTKPTGLTAKYGQTLADVTLPDGWSWMDSSESVGGASTAAKKFMAKFTPTDTDNYNVAENIELEVTVNKADQAALTIQGADSVFYGQTLTLTTTGGSGMGAVTYRIDTAYSTGGAAIDPNTGVLTPAKVGPVSVVATKAGDNDYNDITSAPFVLMIKPATPTGEPKYTKITTSGKTLKDAALTTNGSTLNPNAGELEWVDDEGSVLPNDTTVDANKTYKWRFTPTDTNYTTLTGEIELYHRSSGGGGSYIPSYTVSADKTENGTITVSPKSASKGDTVTITVKPDKGYELDTIKVLDQNGDKVKLTEKDGKYTFKMPDSKVEIQATFVKEAETSPFGDVSTDAYYYEAVKWAQKKGITGGIGNDLFGPNQPCTRAQIATFLWRAAGSPEPKNMSSFSDVPADSYYAKAVAWAVENGITTGTGDGKFSPNAPCTRAQSVTFLYRASGSPAVSDSGVFADVEANAFYADAVAWAVANGVTNGTTSSTFSPDNGCTRAQIVTFLYRAFNK